MILQVPPTQWDDARCWEATEANKSCLLCTEFIIPGESSGQSGKEPTSNIPAQAFLSFMMESFLLSCYALFFSLSFWPQRSIYTLFFVRSQIQGFSTVQLSVRDSKTGLWLSEPDLVTATKKHSGNRHSSETYHCPSGQQFSKPFWGSLEESDCASHNSGVLIWFVRGLSLCLPYVSYSQSCFLYYPQDRWPGKTISWSTFFEP